MSDIDRLNDRELETLFAEIQSTGAVPGSYHHMPDAEVIQYLAGALETNDTRDFEGRLAQDPGLRDYVTDLQAECAPLLEEENLRALQRQIQAALEKPVIIEFFGAAVRGAKQAARAASGMVASLADATRETGEAINEFFFPSNLLLVPVGARGGSDSGAPPISINAPDGLRGSVTIHFQSEPGGDIKLLADGPPDVAGRVLQVGGEDGVELVFSDEGLPMATATVTIPKSACEKGAPNQSVKMEWL